MRTWNCAAFFSIAILMLAHARGQSEEAITHPVEPLPEIASESSTSNETLRAYLQLQQQIHDAQLAIERTRVEAEQARVQNAEQLEKQVRDLDQKLSAQRADEAKFLVYVLGSFAALSFLAVAVTAYFQWRTVHRMAEMTSALNLDRSLALQGSNRLQLPAGEPAQAPVDFSNSRLLSAVERLEKRILELERAAAVPLAPAPEQLAVEREPDLEAIQLNAEAVAAEPGSARELMERGQKLLDEDQPEAAAEIFDQVLVHEPDNAEALVKKGAALERLRRLNEAIACYDQAIAADSSLTIAYLYKGGLFNRMERYGEAVECYEMALRTQEKTVHELKHSVSQAG
ncbi:MAG TPA: tetratricopeptide repeat protein [Verrucomicrobiae bacterium]|nr:tetratricopeptide repeat protein [Verrucomicrobiae bacterium]